MLCISSIALSQEQKQTHIMTSDVTVNFGRLGSDCTGRGICSFEETTNKEEANARLIYNEDESLTIIINRTNISKEDEMKILGIALDNNSKTSDITFVMEEPITLNKETNLESKLVTENVELPRGAFPIVITEEDFTITFK